MFSTRRYWWYCEPCDAFASIEFNVESFNMGGLGFEARRDLGGVLEAMHNRHTCRLESGEGTHIKLERNRSETRRSGG